jgi:hypothetical protein
VCGRRRLKIGSQSQWRAQVGAFREVQQVKSAATKRATGSLVVSLIIDVFCGRSKQLFTCFTCGTSKTRDLVVQPGFDACVPCHC